MRDRNPRTSDNSAARQYRAQETEPALIEREHDGARHSGLETKMTIGRLTRATDGRADNEFSGTPGAFVAALFAIALLAFLFVRLSDQFQSHLKAGAVIGASVALWLLFAALFRIRLGNRVVRLFGVLCATAVVVGGAFAADHYIGREGLKWLSILVVGFYALKLVFNLLERLTDLILIKIMVWIGLGAGAVITLYQVGV